MPWASLPSTALLLPPAQHCVPWRVWGRAEGDMTASLPGAACTLPGTPHQESSPPPHTLGGPGRGRPALLPRRSTAESGPRTQGSRLSGR